MMRARVELYRGFDASGVNAASDARTLLGPCSGSTRWVLVLGVFLGGLAGCRSVSLHGDPTAPATERWLSPRRVYEVAWWKPLVRGRFFEFQPTESAGPAVLVRSSGPDAPSIPRVHVVTVTRDGMVRCVATETGSLAWESSVGGRSVAAPATDGERLFVAVSNGTLVALDASTGRRLWEWQSTEELVTTPVISGEFVLVASQAETLTAVDRATGTWRWQYRRDLPTGFSIRGAPEPRVAGEVLYTGFADGTLVALGLSDGISRWERRIGAAKDGFLDVDAVALSDDGVLVFAAGFRDGVVAVDAASGELRWSATERPGLTALVSVEGVLYGVGDGRVHAIETERGRTLWSLDVSERTSKGRVGNTGRAPVVAGGLLAVPTSTALVFVERASGREVTAWDPGPGVTATPVFSNTETSVGARLYVLSNTGTLFALSLDVPTVGPCESRGPSRGVCRPALASTALP